MLRGNLFCRQCLEVSNQVGNILQCPAEVQTGRHGFTRLAKGSLVEGFPRIVNCNSADILGFTRVAKIDCLSICPMTAGTYGIEKGPALKLTESPVSRNRETESLRVQTNDKRFRLRHFAPRLF